MLESVLSGAAPSARTAHSPRVVVCGTFHRDLETLKRDHASLIEAGCEVLSPTDVDFVAEVEGFVLARHEVAEDPQAVEQRHLEALEQADFIWLHAPEGYVGASAALELGVAHALGIPVFGRDYPRDVTLRRFSEPVKSIEQALLLTDGSRPLAPTRSLDVLQAYYGRVAKQRGYARETPQDTMLLLTEEIGELARAVRKSVGLARHGRSAETNAGAELADVQLYLVHLANVLDIPLAEAVAAKERVNAERFALERAA
jgi:NTP pyrophosphatase (non-canonical NTP hydrolase)